MSTPSNNVTPSPAESSPGSNLRGGLQPPQTAQGAAVTFLTRVTTVKVKPSAEQWRRLRELAWQAMRYKNQHLRAKWALAIKLRAPADSARPKNVETHIRQETYELSGAAYVAAEADVKSAWQRDRKRILAGAPLSQWRHNHSLGIHGHQHRAQSGVRLVEIDGRFFAHLCVQSKAYVTALALDGVESSCWLRVPVAKGTETDDYQAAMLRGMAAGEIAIRRGTLVFNPERGRTWLKLVYRLPVAVPAIGQRVATLGPVTRARRLLCRTELQVKDYTGKLTTIEQRKLDWDQIRRRVCTSIGRAKGAARAKRRKLATHTFDDWAKTYLHQWSRELVDWCETQGVGRIVIADLAGGDWPAHRLEMFIRYKAEAAGMVVDAKASLDDASTERAANNDAKTQQRKAKRYGDAVRTINHEVRQA